MTSLTILKENLTRETFFSGALTRSPKGSAVGNKFGYLCVGAIPFNQNVWFKFSATSLQYRMQQHFRNIHPNFRKLSSGSFLSAFKRAPECVKFLVERFAFRKLFRKSGIQSFLSFGWMESAQNVSKKFCFWENRPHVLRCAKKCAARAY